MNDLKVIILAAGKGVRMNSDTPKVLHKVCGKTIIEHVLDLAVSVGSLKTYVVVGHQASQVKDFLGKNIAVVVQKKLLGTADAVKAASKGLKNFNGDCLIVCGDTPLLRKETVLKLIKRHKVSKAACTVLTAIVKDPKGYGRIVRDGNNNIVGIREEKDATVSEQNIKEINVGTYCFKSSELLSGLSAIKMNTKKKEFYLTDIVALLSQKSKRVDFVTTDDASEGFGINDREDLAAAQDCLRQRILKEFMRQGVTIVDPATTFIDQDVKIGRDTTIKPFTVIESHVRIGKNCIIGPFCHLRPDTTIADHTEVGNFTEVSRSRIGKDCFMKHFSFLGDAMVGNRVNIGAGVVTANFDGKNKNATHIHDDAFIGSDSILVAPVVIGKKSATGAGCVLTKGKKVPAGYVAAGVPARITSKRKF